MIHHKVALFSRVLISWSWFIVASLIPLMSRSSENNLQCDGKDDKKEIKSWKTRRWELRPFVNTGPHWWWWASSSPNQLVMKPSILSVTQFVVLLYCKHSFTAVSSQFTTICNRVAADDIASKNKFSFSYAGTERQWVVTYSPVPPVPFHCGWYVKKEKKRYIIPILRILMKIQHWLFQ